VFGAATAGAAASVCTISSNLVHFMPTLYQLVKSRLPVVFHVNTFGLDSKLVVTADHQAIVALQNAGVVVISSHTVQVRNSYLVSARSVRL
jgi:pyruvate/2-oxoacid:ferredoxin oxidoreductase alpha subunit